MYLIKLESFEKSGSRNSKIFLIFGLGLIGKEIISSLLVKGKIISIIELPFSWNDLNAQDEQVKVIQKEIEKIFQKEKNFRTLNLIWSAGRCGFNASEFETSQELSVFEKIFAVFFSFLDKFRLCFHLISSIGGLFEGTTYLNESNSFCIQRPYGQLKKAQENILTSSPTWLEYRIYRLTSVYGPIRPGIRLGLIQTLILNGLRGDVCSINGNLSTLRDFIYAKDVGKYISKCATGETCGRIIDFLASGRPTSVLQIKHFVEKELRRRLFFRFNFEPSNAQNITVNPNALPEDWFPIEIETGIRMVCSQFIESGFFPKKKS